MADMLTVLGCLLPGTGSADLARLARVHGVMVMFVRVYEWRCSWSCLVLPQPREVLVLHGYPSLSYRECIPVFSEFLETYKVTIVRYILEQQHMLPTLRNQVVDLHILIYPSDVRLLPSRVSISGTLENPSGVIDLKTLQCWPLCPSATFRYRRWPGGFSGRNVAYEQIMDLFSRQGFQNL